MNRVGNGWFSRHIMEKGADEKKALKEAKEEAEKQIDEGILVSKLPPYDFHTWQKTHKGYRNQKLSSLLRRNIIVNAAAWLLFASVGLMFLAYFNSTVSYDLETGTIYRLPDAGYLVLAELSTSGTAIFLGLSALVILVYRRAFDKFYDNSKVLEIAAKNFLGERWYIRLYNGGPWEKEPIATSKLKEQKTEVGAKLAKLKGEFDNPPASLDGKPLSEGEKGAYKLYVQAEITKYEGVDKRIDAYLTNNMTVWSNESRDHKYIWGHRIVKRDDGNGGVKRELVSFIEKEIGWKIYAAVPGPSMEDCTGWNEWPVDLGFKTKMLDNMAFAACIDLPTHPEVIEDPESDSSVIIDVPILGVRDTPNQGLYYNWTEADGILVSKVLDIPLSTSYRSESEQKDSTIADLEQRNLDIKEEKLQLLIPEILDELRRAGRIPEQPQTQIPVQLVTPTEHHSINKGALSGWVAAAIITAVSIVLRFL